LAEPSGNGSLPKRTTCRSRREFCGEALNEHDLSALRPRPAFSDRGARGRLSGTQCPNYWNHLCAKGPLPRSPVTSAGIAPGAHRLAIPIAWRDGRRFRRSTAINRAASPLLTKRSTGRYPLAASTRLYSATLATGLQSTS
jgi:hypothetical protein